MSTLQRSYFPNAIFVLSPFLRSTVVDTNKDHFYLANSWDEHQEELNRKIFKIRREEENAETWPKPYKGGAEPPPSNGGGDIFSAFLWLTVIIVGIVLGVIAGIAALPAALIFLLISKRIFAVTYLAYDDCLKPIFWTTTGYLVMVLIVSVTVNYDPEIANPARNSTLQIAIDFFRFHHWSELGAVKLRILLHLPCIIITAWVLFEKAGNLLSGGKGFGRALLITMLVIIPCMTLSIFLFLIIGMEVAPAVFENYIF